MGFWSRYIAIALISLGPSSCTSNVSADPRACEVVGSYLGLILRDTPEPEFRFAPDLEGPIRAWDDFSIDEDRELKRRWIEYAREPWIEIADQMVWGRLKAPLQISPSEKTGADVVTLIAIRERAGPPNAFSACKNLQRVVQTKPGNPAKPVLRIYLPALSDDGKSALMIVSQEWSQQPSINDETSGLVGGFIVKLTRDADQEWRAKAMQQLWMP